MLAILASTSLGRAQIPTLLQTGCVRAPVHAFVSLLICPRFWAAPNSI